MKDTRPCSTAGNVSGYRCADPTDVGSARSHTFVEIDHEIISTVILHPSTESFKKRKYVHEVLVNRLFKLAQGKSVVR